MPLCPMPLCPYDAVPLCGCDASRQPELRAPPMAHLSHSGAKSVSKGASGLRSRHGRPIETLGVHPLALLALALMLACRAKQGVNQKTFPFLERFFPAPKTQTNLAALQNDDGQWVMPAKNYASTRFSALNQINAGNVKNLRVAWTFSTGHD